MKKFLAFDLGASSGRSIVGMLENKILKLDEIYRFPNSGIQVSGSLYWDLTKLFQDIETGIQLYKKKYGSELESIGIDTWGVDFVLLNEKEELAGPAHTYRDNRTKGVLVEMLKKIPKSEIFKRTGIQFMPINTSTQLFSMIQKDDTELKTAKSLLMIPDYFNYLLSGIKCSEYSIATTTQLFNPIKDSWDYDLIEKLGLKKELFCKIVEPGTILNPIRKSLAIELDISSSVRIIAPLCHDTGSAITAIPVDMEKVKQREWAYISSGTWSLLGVELNKPLINDKAMRYNFTNEGGFNKTSRFLKNLTGLWLIQECKKLWNKEDINMNWEDLEKFAEKATPFKFFINPDEPCFLNPSNMVQEIKSYCKKHKQGFPNSIGEITRTIYESIAFNYKRALNSLEEILEDKIKLIHIIGGGSLNNILNQFTANALNIPVISGPSEATAVGNILIQALALGEIENIKELRSIVQKSFQLREYLPEKVKKWNEAYNLFLEKTSKSI
ncbi:MAG: rhamnulokinase family protein [Promethearchaeota archaeon]